MISSRADVHVSVEMMMSTSPRWSAGIRLGVVTHVRLTRLRRPNASSANRRATSTSYPAILFCRLM